MGQKTENLFGRESMQPNPERAALRRSPAEEERLTEFNAYSMTTKGSVLAHITDQIEQAIHDKRYLHVSASYGGYIPLI